MYKTTCPKGHSPIYLHAATVTEIRGPVTIEADGFSLDDAKGFSTEDEQTYCPTCKSIQPLEAR